MASKRATASATLLVCSGPIRCSSISGKALRSAGHLPAASCTRFSPKRRWPASSVGMMSAAPLVFDTATRRMPSGARPAAAAAAAMRALTAARRSAALSGVFGGIEAGWVRHDGRMARFGVREKGPEAFDLGTRLRN